MFTSLKIKNFKAFKNEQTIRIAPITLIYGPNSAGKSSIIQSMLLLSQSLKNLDALKNLELTPKGPHLDLGIPQNYLHKGNVNLPLEFSFTNKITIDRIGGPFDRKKQSKKETKCFDTKIVISYKQEDVNDSYSPLKLVKVSYKISPVNEISEFSFSFIPSLSDKTEFILETKKDANSLAQLLHNCGGEIMRLTRLRSSTNISEDVAKFTLSQAYEFLSTSKFTSAQFSTISPTGFFPTYVPRNSFYQEKNYEGQSDASEDIAQSLNRLMSHFNEPILRAVKNGDYISGLRNSPQRFYALSNAKDYVGKSGEDMATLLYRLAKSQKSNELNKWLKILDIPYSIKVEPVKDNLAGSLLIIKLKDLRNNVEVTPSDVGIGISQILPLLVQGLSDIAKDSRRSFSGRVGSLKYVEQPELHLHPRLQANLADFFIKTTETNKQLKWLLETHSEALILRLQKRIRNNMLNPDLVAVHYVNPVKGGHSEVIELRLDQDGDFIDEWPNGFFEEAYKEKFLD
jgi:hypothetical protein